MCVPFLMSALFVFKKKSLELFFQLAFSVCSVEILSEVTKYIIPIKRPFVAMGFGNPGIWLPFSENSFFSGHTGVLFTMGTIFWNKNRFLSFACFGFGIIVGALRVVIKAHYPIDIIGGAVFGVLIGVLVNRFIVFKK